MLKKRRPRIDHDERRIAILRSGARVFLEKGLRGATMDDVAAELNLSKGLIYRQFSSKDDLIAAIFEEVLAVLGRLKVEPWGGYHAGTVGTIAAARENPEAFLLLYRECRGDPVYRIHASQLEELYVDWLMRFFEDQKGQSSKEARRAEMAVRNLTGFLFEALSNWLTEGDAAEDPIFAAWIGDIIKSWRRSTIAHWNLPDI